MTETKSLILKSQFVVELANLEYYKEYSLQAIRDYIAAAKRGNHKSIMTEYKDGSDWYGYLIPVEVISKWLQECATYHGCHGYVLNEGDRKAMDQKYIRAKFFLIFRKNRGKSYPKAAWNKQSADVCRMYAPTHKRLQHA